MKTLKKVSLFTPEGLGDMKVLSEEQMRAIIGGYVDGYCYFYCLDYLNQTYTNSDMDVNGYMASYASVYGFGDLVAGGISDLSRIRDFTGSNFDTATVDIKNMSSFLDGSTTILAGIVVGDNDHAVVIKGYNSSTGEYTYYDPAKGKESSLPANKFTFALGVTGGTGGY